MGSMTFSIKLSMGKISGKELKAWWFNPRNGEATEIGLVQNNGEKEFSHDERFGQIIYEVYFEDSLNEYNLVIYCSKTQISQTFIRRGPPSDEKVHVQKFKTKNPHCFEKDGYLWIESKRKFTDFQDFLKDHVKSKIPENLELLNLSNANNTISNSCKKAIHVLLNMVLPFYINKDA